MESKSRFPQCTKVSIPGVETPPTWLACGVSSYFFLIIFNRIFFVDCFGSCQRYAFPPPPCFFRFLLWFCWWLFRRCWNGCLGRRGALCVATTTTLTRPLSAIGATGRSTCTASSPSLSRYCDARRVSMFLSSNEATVECHPHWYRPHSTVIE